MTNIFGKNINDTTTLAGINISLDGYIKANSASPAPSVSEANSGRMYF